MVVHLTRSLYLMREQDEMDGTKVVSILTTKLLLRLNQRKFKEFSFPLFSLFFLSRKILGNGFRSGTYHPWILIVSRNKKNLRDGLVREIANRPIWEMPSQFVPPFFFLLKIIQESNLCFFTFINISLRISEFYFYYYYFSQVACKKQVFFFFYYFFLLNFRKKVINNLSLVDNINGLVK